MGQTTSSALPGGVSNEMENWVRAGVNVYTPKTLSVVNATERAPELQARELGLSATYYLLNPRAIDWGLVGGAVRNGWVDKLRILFDAREMQTFGPKLEIVLSYADKITSLELFCDQLPVAPFLQFFLFPNILDALPATCPALSSFYLATNHTQQVHFDVIARILLKARNLKALKIEGPLIARGTHDVSSARVDYDFLCLKYVDIKRATFEQILCRSAASLRVLHIEHVTTLEMVSLATVIGKMLSNLKYLTVIIPDVVALHASNVTLAGLIDSASAQPVLYLEYLYCTGMSITDETLMRQSNSIGIIRTPFPSLQRLFLHDCRQLSVEAVIMAIVYRRLPRLAHLEAIWPLELLQEGEYNMLAKACADRRIQMTPAMTAHYAPLFLAEQEAKEKAKIELDNDARSIAKKLGAASPSTVPTMRTPRMSSKGKGRRRRSTKYRKSRSDRQSRKSSSRSSFSDEVDSDTESDSSDSTTASLTESDSDTVESGSTEDSRGGRREQHHSRRSTRRSGSRRH